MVEVKPIDVSCSSQDPAFPALNLVRGALKPSDERKQWLCLSPDEKFAHVTLTYEKPFVISSLEIKNNGSAYVQVEGSSSQEPSKYKVLWKTKNLMTPSESRLGTDADGIYIFLPQDLATAEKDKTWDMLKITCSQPFNKIQKYGLSHVVARSALPVKEEIPSSPSHCAGDLPIPSLKREPVEDDRANSVQAHKDPDKVLEHQNQMSSEVSSSGCSEAVIPFTSPVKQENPSADELYYSQRSEPSSSGSSTLRQHDILSPSVKRENSLHIIADSRSAEDETLVGNSSPLKRRISESDGTSDASSDETQIIKRPAPSQIMYKPFNKLLEGVKIVISGFQNPYRAEIRNRAIQMGASYSPNWTELSTHLVCAFLNTPKYRQAAADHGLIVTRDWIDQCSIQRKRLPWKRFALNPSERSFDGTGVEIWELVPSTTNSLLSSDTQGSSISPRNTERSVEGLPIGGVHSTSPGHCSTQSRSSIVSMSPVTPGVKKEVSDHGDSSSNPLCVMAEISADGTSRHSLHSGCVVSPRHEHDVPVKREVNTDEVQDSWQDCANNQQGPSTVLSSASEHCQFRRLQASNPSPKHHLHYSSIPGTSGTLDHETLRSTACNSSSLEPGSDGYAGYYRPISQPCAVPHSSPSAAYLVPPVIMLPQSLPQYFVPVSQHIQAPPPSRDTYMARTIPSPQVQGQHIRVIQHSNKAAGDEESSKQRENV